MKRLLSLSYQQTFLRTLTMFFVLTCNSVSAKELHTLYTAKDTIPIVGRWDLTIDIAGKKSPSWLEVTHSGLRMLIGQFTGTGGSARPISKVNYTDGNFSFSIPPQWEKEDSDLVVKGIVTGDNISGSMTFSDGKVHTYTGVRAPALKRMAKPTWGKAIQLFNGTDLKGWHTMGENQWIVESGVLRSPKSGSNLVTDNTFNDFKLHIEFRYPKGSNSGVYLRGRYEVQIEDSGTEPIKNELGSIYGFLSPTELVAKGPGQWQTYDITLVGRMVTIVANGVTIICNQEIPGITGGALNSNEGEPGPLLIQGDHGPIDYRNIVLTPAK